MGYVTMLFQRANIYRATTTVDEAGTTSEAFALIYAKARCYSESFSELFMAPDGRIGAAVKNTLFFERKLSLQTGDKVDVIDDGKSYRIESCSLVHNHHLECTASAIESPQTAGGA